MSEAYETITIPLIQQRKREGKKSIGVVAWDYPTTRFADLAGADFIVVGDSVGVNLWGHATPLEVTLDEILICCKAVRRATERMVVSCDMPYGPVQEGLSSAMKAAVRIIKEGGADMIKVDAAANHPDVVKAMAEHKYGSAVVLRDQRVLGIFTTVDVCRALGEVLQARTAA